MPRALSQLNPHEGGDNRQWQRKPRAGRRRPARNGKLTSPVKKGAPCRPLFHVRPFQTSYLVTSYLVEQRSRHRTSVLPCLSVIHAHAANDVALLNLIDHFHAGNHPSEDGVL